jgi:mannose-6-phosphate isomerase-like protein (cupin superfamily)
MKLVVTGHDAAGKAVFSHAGAPPRSAGPGSFDLWTTDAPLAVPDDADPAAPASIGYFPVAGQTAFRIVSVPPGAGHLDVSVLPEELRHFFDPNDAAMHTTDTIDYVIILGGAADLELDDGVAERVKTGDCVVQRGTRHAWRVVGDEPLVLGAVLIGATRR